jgi:hypothetical protein
MLGKGGQRAFRGVENGSEIGTGLDDGGVFVRREGGINVHVKVGVTDSSHGCFGVTLGPSH